MRISYDIRQLQSDVLEPLLKRHINANWACDEETVELNRLHAVADELRREVRSADWDGEDLFDAAELAVNQLIKAAEQLRAEIKLARSEVLCPL